MRTNGTTGLLAQPARIAGILGIAFIVLFVVGVIAQGETPTRTDSVEEIRSYFADDGEMYLIGDFLVGLALVFLFLPFAAFLRTVFLRSEGEPGALSSLFFAGAILALAVGAMGSIGWGTLAMGAQNESFADANVMMLMYMSDYAFSGLTLAFGLTALSGALVMLTTGAVAKWTGYLGLVAAALNVIGATWVIDGDPEGVLAILGFIGLLVFGLWVLGTSIMLLRQGETTRIAAQPAAV